MELKEFIEILASTTFVQQLPKASVLTANAMQMSLEF